jgi:hypothetical protein
MQQRNNKKWQTANPPKSKPHGFKRWSPQCGEGSHFKETWQTKEYQGIDGPWEAQIKQRCSYEGEIQTMITGRDKQSVRATKNRNSQSKEV